MRNVLAGPVGLLLLACSCLAAGAAVGAGAAGPSRVAGAPGAARAAATDAPAPAQPLHVFASILPQAWFLERLGGERVAVDVLVGPGQNEATLDPTPRQLARLSEADAFFTIGVPMEQGLVPRLRRTLPQLRIVAMDAGLPRRELPAHADEGAEHGHEEGEQDPHVWLSPRLGKTMARTAAAALAEIDPAGEALYGRRLAALETELDSLDACLGRLLAPVRGRRLVTFHPSYGYLAADYGLRQLAVEQGGLNPSPRHLAALRETIEREGIGAIFVQPQFSTSAAEAAVQGMGIEIVRLDPLAPDWAANLLRMAGLIRRALGGGPPPAAGGACPGLALGSGDGGEGGGGDR